MLRLKKCIIVSFFSYLRTTMKLQHSSYKKYIALILFASFAATLFPFEFFHTHNTVPLCQSSGDDSGICHHKSHLASRESYCWACTIHVEKTYALNTTALTAQADYSTSFYNICITAHCVNNNLHTALRGPPFFYTA